MKDSIEEKKEREWTPIIAGNCTGYAPEFFDKDSGKWRQVPTHKVPTGKGIPHPDFMGGVLMGIHLFGHSQAQALAWSFAAVHESFGKDIQVRVQDYDVVFDIKARKIEKKGGEE